MNNIKDSKILTAPLQLLTTLLHQNLDMKVPKANVKISAPHPYPIKTNVYSNHKTFWSIWKPLVTIRIIIKLKLEMVIKLMHS